MDVIDVVNQWPLVTRILIVGTAVTSVLVHSHLLSGSYVVYQPYLVFQMPPNIPEIWRLVTSFWLTGKGLSILFDCYFLYTYSSGLERGSPRFTEPGSYIVFIVFIMASILVFGSTLFPNYLFLQPLILAMAYIFAQDNPNSNVTIFIITFPAKYLPYALLLITLLSSSPANAWSQLSGLFAGHLYDFLTRIWPTFGGGTNYLPTPLAVGRWYLKMSGRVQRRDYGTAVHPTGPGGSDIDRWDGGRGPGRRLG